jgi:2,4-dienoyl-CoA reductase-like NADH-dependent reductase (Old Yellow Enzyme family)
LQDAYVRAAAVARRAGFDFIDLKQCHRYLLNELLAAHGRPGPYGGSYANRTRFITELVARLRSELPDLMLATRLNVYDGVPYRKSTETGEGMPEVRSGTTCSTWGTDRADPSRPDLEEPLRLIGELQASGVGLINVSLGNPYASPHLLRPYDYAPVDGYAPPEHPLIGVWRHLSLTARVQHAYPELAVVGSGYSWLQRFLPDVGAALVARGDVSFVGVGRGSLSQPDFARAILAGEAFDPRRTCRTFSYCTALMRNKNHPLGQYPTGCPPFDKEVYGPIWDEAQGRATKPD